MTLPASQIARLARIGLNSHRAEQLATFYVEALGFVVSGRDRREGDHFAASFGVHGGAMRITLTLGAEVIELLQFDQPGAAYPDNQLSNSLLFQHFAIVVSDMERAYARLSSRPGWQSISTDGPQQLPKSSGHVIAFKFRDPDGHPLELLQFPGNGGARHAALFLGIDHSAISVSNSATSIAFYADLGWSVAARSINTGIPQQRLDDLPNVNVEVTALEAVHAAPHLELLCYTQPVALASMQARAHDVAATRLMFDRTAQGGEGGDAMARDPDGHWLEFLKTPTKAP